MIDSIILLIILSLFFIVFLLERLYFYLFYNTSINHPKTPKIPQEISNSSSTEYKDNVTDGSPL